MTVYSDHSSRPLGYHFHPTDKEVMQYLLGFVIGRSLPEQHEVMQDVDLYADKDPWQIFEAYEGTKNSRYFITRQKKENPKWKRVSRTVGNGTWKSQNKGKEVFDNKGRFMGYVKSLKYIPANKSSNNVNGEWLMTEYSLYDGYVNADKIKNKGYVVCKIKKKEKPGDKRKGNNNENMRDIEEYVDSILQDDEIPKGEENITECVEGDEVGDHVLPLLSSDDDDENIEEGLDQGDGVEDFINSVLQDNEIAIGEENTTECMEEDEIGDHVIALLGNSDEKENIEECLDQGNEVDHVYANTLRSADDVDLDSITFIL